MRHELDRIVDRLRDQPAPARLHWLEADLARTLARPRIVAPSPAWRGVVVGVALAAGLGIGGSAAALTRAPDSSYDLVSGARLAPSTLLGTAG